MKTIREKLKWLMEHDNNALKTICADKLKVRTYIKNKLKLKDDSMFVPILAIYDKASDIDFDKLPDKFVLKCNHGSGFNIVCTDKSKLDKKKAIESLNKWMAEDYSTRHGELHYHGIEHKIFCEPYLDRSNFLDYKFWCFHGDPKFFTVNSDVSVKRYPITFYGIDGKLLKYSRKDHPSTKKQMEFNKAMLSKMIAYSEILSKDFKHVRVDFLVIEDKFYFGEMTFISNCSNIDFEDPKDDVEVGNFLKI